jgi:hypothetical protein
LEIARATLFSWVLLLPMVIVTVSVLTTADETATVLAPGPLAAAGCTLHSAQQAAALMHAAPKVKSRLLIMGEQSPAVRLRVLS